MRFRVQVALTCHGHAYHSRSGLSVGSYFSMCSSSRWRTWVAPLLLPLHATPHGHTVHTTRPRHKSLRRSSSFGHLNTTRRAHVAVLFQSIHRSAFDRASATTSRGPAGPRCARNGRIVVPGGVAVFESTQDTSMHHRPVAQVVLYPFGATFAPDRAFPRFRFIISLCTG